MIAAARPRRPSVTNAAQRLVCALAQGSEALEWQAVLLCSLPALTRATDLGWLEWRRAPGKTAPVLWCRLTSAGLAEAMTPRRQP